MDKEIVIISGGFSGNGVGGAIVVALLKYRVSQSNYTERTTS